MTISRVGQTSEKIGYRRLAIILSVALAWVGLWMHEFYRVPSALGLTLDGSLPLLAIAIVLLVWRLRAADKRAATWALLIFGLINGIGGFLSVLPLPFLPFAPEQTLEHYLVHIWYALCQAPLIVVTLAALLARRARCA
jgi:hypothetical protein